MFRFSPTTVLAGATLLTGLGLGLRASAAAPALACDNDDTLHIKLSEGATMTLFVKNQDELRRLRAYKMDSLLTLLDRYLTQAQNVSKAAGDAGRTTLEFYPARDLGNPTAPEKLRVVVYNEKNQPTITTTRVDVGRGVTVRVQEGADGNQTTQVRVVDTGVKVTETADDGTKIKIGRQAIIDDSLAAIDQEKKDIRCDERRTEEYLSLAFGFNSLLNVERAEVAGTSPATTAPIDLRPWGSRYVSLGFMSDTRLFKHPRSAPFVRYGIQAAFNNYMLEGNRQWVDDTDNVTRIAAAPDGRSYQKSKLATSAVQVPVLLGFRFHNQKGDESVSFAAGGFAGYRINARTKVKYVEDGDTKKVKDRDDYNLENFQYGLLGSVSVFGHELFASYNLNELFRKDRGPQANVLAFGVTLIGNEHNLKSKKYRTSGGMAMR